MHQPAVILHFHRSYECTSHCTSAPQPVRLLNASGNHYCAAQTIEKNWLQRACHFLWESQKHSSFLHPVHCSQQHFHPPVVIRPVFYRRSVHPIHIAVDHAEHTKMKKTKQQIFIPLLILWPSSEALLLSFLLPAIGVYNSSNKINKSWCNHWKLGPLTVDTPWLFSPSFMSAPLPQAFWSKTIPSLIPWINLRSGFCF